MNPENADVTSHFCGKKALQRLAVLACFSRKNCEATYKSEVWARDGLKLPWIWNLYMPWCWLHVYCVLWVYSCVFFPDWWKPKASATSLRWLSVLRLFQDLSQRDLKATVPWTWWFRRSSGHDHTDIGMNKVSKVEQKGEERRASGYVRLYSMREYAQNYQ